MAQTSFSTIRDAVIGAIAVSIVGVAGNWLSSGGLVRILGGISKAELQENVSKVLPKGTVVAFDGSCPSGWSPFKDGFGRVIVGAGKGETLQNNRPFRVPGGSETIKLEVANLPKHSHTTNIAPGAPGKAPGDGARIEFMANGIDRGAQETSGTGEGRALDYMPPFIPLNVCAKDS